MSLIITGIVDGPLPGGLPKAIELHAAADIPDLSIYGLGVASNGGPSDGVELALSGAAVAGQYLYVATPQSVSEGAMQAFLGVDADFASGVASVNGDDAVELFLNGAPIDAFGVVGTDGTGEPWEYLDGWAARVPGTAASPVFDPADWIFSGRDALDGEATNAGAATPFPIGTGGGGAPPAPRDRHQRGRLRHAPASTRPSSWSSTTAAPAARPSTG